MAQLGASLLCVRATLPRMLSVSHVPSSSLVPSLPVLGRSSEESCMFPFSYKGKEYTACTVVDKKRPWCCGMAEQFGQLPSFIYKGKTHHSCMAVDDQMGRPWCAATPNYDKDHLRCFCFSEGESQL
uniref:Fibronectin type-II domain-containing protein n=1 Tax=Chelonoidis abingdonii TaxID=106734 RepID=A0A8C0GUI1_CHEAB